ncbi:YkgJ family cysteine cluster protein [Candidatus Woesearchaeota archaeon]|nr:YkgJ family cysteine cluster protein [Candidatus Woesearchaeota archaeon]
MKINKKTPLREIFKVGRACSQCGHCCANGTGFLAEHDIKYISEYLGMTREELINECLEPVTLFNTTRYRPVLVQNGKIKTCIFYDNGCSIHDVKPLLCRVGNCSEHGEDLSVWFRLNFFVNVNDAESIRQWKTYLDSGGKNIPGGKLSELVPDTVKLIKILNYEVLN